MSSSHGEKRPKGGGKFTLCSSVVAKCGTESKNLCRNRLYEYDDDETWNDVLHDVLEGEDFTLHKTDTVNAVVADKLMGTITFTPDMEEPIRIVKEFDQTLKSVNRDKDVHCDVTFRVGKEGKLVHVHKYVLASRSPVFDAMLYGDLAESDDIIVPDIEPSSFDALLRYLYCDDISFTPDTVTSVLYAADKYGVDDLVTKIKSYLDQNITNETVLTVLESAKLFNLEDLLQKCEDFIASDPFPVLQSSSALEITKETLTYIISLDSLVMDELDIYHFLIKWTENQCDKVGIEKTDPNIRAMMGDLIYLIRFPFMNLESFAKDVCNRDILNAQEKLNLQQVIVGNLDKTSTKFKFEKRICKTFCVLPGESPRYMGVWSYRRNLEDCIEFT
ncbi:BTB/POZ domain-containing protein 6-like [Ostrea edulis]|uniref:BTB/POZ domain-containing protein 6-like n=1 Tax=Ostrea edulis TaxID=37623 RepID=UPI0020956C92|nr:BTB/POZ domain-containing protein 6-like [Ostrea edulis]